LRLLVLTGFNDDILPPGIQYIEKGTGNIGIRYVQVYTARNKLDSEQTLCTGFRVTWLILLECYTSESNIVLENN
jgi:hypothetical protein